MELLHDIIKNEITCLDERNMPEQYTALQLAVLRSSVLTVKLLLEAGADPNMKDANLNTPVHIAAKNGNYEILDYLLQTAVNIFV